MNVVAIPFAMGRDGRLWSCVDAPKSGLFACPGCRERVIPRRGSQKQAHFAHKPGSLCVGESTRHLLAKMMVRQVLRDWKSGLGPEPSFVLPCSVCNQPRIRSAFPAFDDVRLEVPYPVQGGFNEDFAVVGYRVLDVALVSQGLVVGGIEVCATHAVDDDKAKELGGLSWIEVFAQDVIESSTRWSPTQESWIHDWDDPYAQVCGDCVARVDAFYDLRKKLSVMRRQPILDWKLRTAPHRCPGCGMAILVYTWNDDLEMAMAEAEMWVVPPTLQYRYLDVERRSNWVNTCPCCKEIQGEYSRFNDAKWPFYRFRFHDDDTRTDYLKVAYHLEAHVGRKFPRPTVAKATESHEAAISTA